MSPFGLLTDEKHEVIGRPRRGPDPGRLRQFPPQRQHGHRDDFHAGFHEIPQMAGNRVVVVKM
ncbi:MAG: hypothetical protein MZU84_05690 [Sphingobacterium sp.]|nr:hypothetical protein [Sphingobacterium sp.]